MNQLLAMIKEAVRSQLLRRGWTAPGDVSAANRWSMRQGLALMKSLSIAPRTMIDLGAAEGTWSLLAREVFRDASFVLCEPLPQRKDALAKIVAEGQGKFVHLPVVIGNQEGTVRFDVSEDLDGSGVYGGKSEHVIELPQNTLDHVLKSISMDHPYLIKFDTHGYESQILQGASETLALTSAIVMECYAHHVSPTAKLFWQMCGELESLGFRPVYISDLLARPLDDCIWQMDIFFVRSSHEVFRSSSYR